MILWVVLIIVAIIVLFLLWWISGNTQNLESNSEFGSYPTIHARCKSSSMCGGDLVCDLNCHRCRKKLGGDCANDNDCESGLHCHNWRCVDDDVPPIDNPIDTTKVDTKEVKAVKWDETRNKTYYI